MVKPDRPTAMKQLIQQVRAVMPFDLPQANRCSGTCNGCSQKLLDFLSSELQDWEYRLAQGESPDFGDIHRMTKTSRKIYRVMQRNGLVVKASDNRS